MTMTHSEMDKSHADALRRHGYMWEVGNVHAEGKVRVKLLDHGDVLLPPCVAHRLGQSLIETAIDMLQEDA